MTNWFVSRHRAVNGCARRRCHGNRPSRPLRGAGRRRGDRYPARGHRGRRPGPRRGFSWFLERPARRGTRAELTADEMVVLRRGGGVPGERCGRRSTCPNQFDRGATTMTHVLATFLGAPTAAARRPDGRARTTRRLSTIFGNANLLPRPACTQEPLLPFGAARAPGQDLAMPSTKWSFRHPGSAWNESPLRWHSRPAQTGPRRPWRRASRDEVQEKDLRPAGRSGWARCSG